MEGLQREEKKEKKCVSQVEMLIFLFVIFSLLLLHKEPYV